MTQSAQLSFGDTLERLKSFNEVAPHIVEAFWKHHRENPKIYELVKMYANQVKKTGRDRYSIVAIFERIRWHLTIETNDADFKINNNYRSCYARLMMMEHPTFDGFFQTRLSPGTTEITK